MHFDNTTYSVVRWTDIFVFFLGGFSLCPSSFAIVLCLMSSTDIWPSDCESSELCVGALFSSVATVCSSVCFSGGAAFLCWFLFFLEACLMRQTRMRTSWNVPSLYRSDQDVPAVTI